MGGVVLADCVAVNKAAKKVVIIPVTAGALFESDPASAVCTCTTSTPVGNVSLGPFGYLHHLHQHSPRSVCQILTPLQQGSQTPLLRRPRRT